MAALAWTVDGEPVPLQPPVSSTPPPHDARVLARGVLAGAATEVLLGAALLLLWRALYGRVPPAAAALLLFSLGAGLTAGLAWGIAEVAARRVARPWLGATLGLLVGAALAAGAPLAGDYVLQLQKTGSSMKALDALLASLRPAPSPWLFLSGAVCLYGPLLAVRRLGEGFTREALAMSLGLLAWGLALEAAAFAGADVSVGPLNLSLLLVLLLGRALVVPLALRGADRLCVALGRRARGEVAGPRRQAPTVAARTPGAIERTRARSHDERASAHQAEGLFAEAATARAAAFDLWPTPERAVWLARAHASALAVEPALAALEDAAALAGARATSFDPAEPSWEPLRGHARFEALASSRQAASRRAPGPGARLLLTIYVTTLALASAAPVVLAPTESAELTRLRLRAWLTGDGAAWWSLGQQLAAGAPVSRPRPSLGWTPGLLVRLKTTFPSPAPELALGAFLRSAEAGHAPGMVRVAEALSCYPDRQVQAAGWCRRAAERGDPEGMWRWSRMVRGGWFGMASDQVSGGEWLQRAADAGCAEAQVDLGRVLARRGEREAARAWFERASAAGHGTAEDELEALEAADDVAAGGEQ